MELQPHQLQNYLFQVSKNSILLDNKTADLFHHMVAQLLYLCKPVRGDLMATVAFLTTRMAKPDTDDYKKLAGCIRYLRLAKDIPLTLEIDREGQLQWWVDASFAVHQDMNSHTGALLTMGKGALIGISTKQKIHRDRTGGLRN